MRTGRVVGLVVVWVAFAIYSGVAVWERGYLGVWEAGFDNVASLQILTDLGIALFLIASWMVGDAKARGATVWPYLVVTFALGSFGPLTYLLVREVQRPRVPAA